MSPLSIATAKEVFDLLRDDLAAIEQEFTRQSASDVEVITDIATYLMSGGGKRIRPTLLLLSALTSFAPRRMMPVRSASRPTSKPLTSWINKIGSRLWLQSSTNRAALSALSA